MMRYLFVHVLMPGDAALKHIAQRKRQGGQNVMPVDGGCPNP